jgi:chromosome segregation ATPase
MSVLAAIATAIQSTHEDLRELTEELHELGARWRRLQEEERQLLEQIRAEIARIGVPRG